MKENGLAHFEVPDMPYMVWGLGIAPRVGFGVEMMSRTMDFTSAGGDFVIRPPDEPAE